MASTLNVTHLGHDLEARRAYVTLVWADDPSRRLGVEVPYDTTMRDAEAAARQALVTLARELDECILVTPPQA